MSSRNTQLDDLRRQIDRLDDRIHDLLIERSAMIEQIVAAKRDGQAKLRPGREAEIARRLVGRHQGQFPAASVVRIWREIINAFTCMQGPFSIALPEPAADPALWELARDHFGGTPKRIAMADPGAALQAAIAGDVTLAVLPWGERAGTWLRRMLDEGLPETHICFGLPFVRTGRDGGTEAVAVGRVEAEATGRDRSVIAVGDPRIADRAEIDSAAIEIGLEPLDCGPADGGSGPLWLLEVAGRLEPSSDAAGRLDAAMPAGARRVALLGSYAEPIVLSEEEHAGA